MFGYANKMKKLSDRVSFLKEKTGWSNAEIARRAGVSRTTPTDWLSGKTQDMSAKVAEKLSQETEFSAIWLATGKGEIFQSNIEKLERSESVPVISWVAAGNWATMQDQRAEPLEWLMCPVKHSKDTYALIVKGLSMSNPSGERSFKDGDVIFVDPSIEALNKDFVVAKLENENEATFKQLVIEDGQKNLMAINPDWKPKFMKINGNATILGVVIGKVERWR